MRADREAEFEAFVATHSDELMRVAMGLTGDRGHAEDLVQTALLKACRHWGLVIVAMFLVVWTIALAVWKLGRVEQRWNEASAAAPSEDFPTS